MLSFILATILVYPIGYFVSHETKTNQISLEKEKVSFSDTLEVFIINLDQSKERFEKIHPLVLRLGFLTKRISAVDGSQLQENDIKEKVDKNQYLKFMGDMPKKGTIGCSLSHIKTWEKFLMSNAEYAIVFEDDVSFDPEKLKLIIQELIQNKKLWDIVTFEIHRSGNPLTIKKLQNKQEIAVYLTEMTDAGAYILNRNAAKKLLEKALPINIPIDLYYSRGWEFGLKFLGIENPRMVHQTFGDSEIRKTKSIQHQKNPASKNISVRIHKALFRIQTTIIRFFYNLKIYLQFKVNN
ncbi:MAG: hypothetical protein C0432_02920 [Candidatus Puniceispirillum sp.]|nr:hypothetical protein [Candidatus Pelagibacter sp.]MBA4283228.1 hypothetical protein [Candidatus Puniceispirillum sp.]